MKHEQPEATKGNILIVDDALDNLNLLYATLTQQGYGVRKAINGSMALMGVQAAPPDLILLDIRMPDMDGYEVCQLLKASEETRDIPIIFLSALDEPLDKVQAFSLGAADYITKPFQTEEVLARIENQLALQAAKAEIRRFNAELEQRVQQRTAQLEAANQELQREIRERQRAEETLRQQAEQKQLVTAIAQHIRQSLDLDTILNTTVAEIRQLLQVDRVLIYRFEPDWSGVVVVESVAKRDYSIIEKTFIDHCFQQGFVEQYRQGRIQNLEDIYTGGLAQCHIDLLADLGVRANLVVPIVQEEKLWGLLLANQCVQPRQWTPLEIDLMKQLSTQVAIAIQQSELYHQVRQFNTKLERQVQERTLQLQQSLDFEAALKRITDKVRDSLDESQILQAAVQELAHVLQIECCNAGIYNADLTASTIAFEYTTSLPYYQGLVVQMVNHSEIYRQLLQHQSIQLCYTQPRLIREAYYQFAILACSVADDQGVIGDLWLFKPKEAMFEDLEVRLVQQVANQCAIALRQARLYAAAQTQVETLEGLHHLKDDFLSTVSHELRSPVTNMRMAIQMLEVALEQIEVGFTETGVDSPSNKAVQRAIHYLNILDSECDREINLVNDLLDLQRLEAGVQDTDTDWIDLNLWLLSLIDAFEERTQARQQRLQVETPTLLPQICSNFDALSRILTELLHNACKYTPPGETITVTAQVDPSSRFSLQSLSLIRSQEAGKAVRLATFLLSVTNFGVEIPADELPRIFEKFYRVASTDRWQQGGTGLGLALVKKLVEHLGGTIEVRSIQRQTTFRIELPITC
ncbi:MULTISPECIES: GAF domain-containing protein [unclassified Leptolyngbya]|uniref:hybrid sensor histidine kinase/response regulator n=1 Tax=unclassified Leptolyngbya TaxID=2650499 RepID=UPI001685CD65|nr:MULTISPECIES: GAF domain-containing protein [unclassified Leptolyngbya]MBD1912841.1 GAF domain-containing protein [Leptolyngbya sp. FACHB-8]MBD2153117.1 GAF domain-containing protein [Leptolyngbya sp. FACHB-16]